jgi:hypothetical protein
MLNLVFLAFLLVPIPQYKLHRIRHWIAIPLGFMLFWHDTWLPGPESIASQGSQIAGFSADYIWDLVTRFINWNMVGAFFVLLVLWLFISQWLRVTVFVSAIVVWLAVSPLLPSFTFGRQVSRRPRRRTPPLIRPAERPSRPILRRRITIFRRRPSRRRRPI